MRRNGDQIEPGAGIRPENIDEIHGDLGTAQIDVRDGAARRSTAGITSVQHNDPGVDAEIAVGRPVSVCVVGEVVR